MIITNEKIEVTFDMMYRNNMTNFGKYGVPLDPKIPSMGLHWKRIEELSEEDFQKIEEYFLLKEVL